MWVRPTGRQKGLLINMVIKEYTTGEETLRRLYFKQENVRNFSKRAQLETPEIQFSGV